MARGSVVLAPLLLLAGCGSSDNAYIRMLNVSQDYSSVDVYIGSSTTTPAISGITSGTASSYVGVAPGTDTVYFTAAGETQSDALSSESETFTDSEHRTYVTYGDTGEFGELEIDEDEATPSSGYASVEVLNTATDAGALDVYLTSSGTALSQVSPTFSDIAVGKASSYTTLTDGTYELSVTGTGVYSDVRLQISGITLSSEEVVSIIISESAGGYLVNAYLLQQQGSLTAENNPDARVRAVNGLASGSVSVSIGSGSSAVSLLSSAATPSISTYQLVPVGTEPVSVTVSGSAVTAPDETLSPGGDYTYLVYQNAGTTEENLITDTNDIPLSGYATVRLINAMSGTGDPISLSVNYVPVANSIALGDASDYDTEVTATTAGVLSLTDTSNDDAIAIPSGSSCSSPVTFTAQQVYTTFMFGSDASPTCVLNADRAAPPAD